MKPVRIERNEQQINLDHEKQAECENFIGALHTAITSFPYENSQKNRTEQNIPGVSSHRTETLPISSTHFTPLSTTIGSVSLVRMTSTTFISYIDWSNREEEKKNMKKNDEVISC
jgi:hypothetical protein